MIVLDTCVWIWWVDATRGKLSHKQREVIEQASQTEGGLGICAISVWEIAIKVALARDESLVLSRPVEEWIGFALSYPGVELIPLSHEISILSTKLKDHPFTNPGDQIITATALVYKCPLITSDKKIRDYPVVETI